MPNAITVALVLLGALVLVTGDLTIGNPKCGEKRCKPDEFCSTPDYFCSSCAIACDRASHNYEEKTCEKECQSELLLFVVTLCNVLLKQECALLF